MGGIAATEPGGGKIYRLDLSEFGGVDWRDPVALRRAWDTVQMAASIQGIVNRDAPRLFLRCMPEVDDFWWDYLRGEHGWLRECEVVELSGPGYLLDVFGDDLAGVILYREEEPWGSNIAATIAGAENRLVLREDDSPGSLYQEMRGYPNFPADVARVPSPGSGGMLDNNGKIAGTGEASTGSAKNDAYRWALSRYLATGASGTTDLAYFIDAWWLKAQDASEGFWNSTLTNHDFYISKRAFFFDLNPVPGGAPVDDPGQTPGLDRETLRKILREMAGQAGCEVFAVGGFLPWRWKYAGPDGDWPGAGGSQHPVLCEWEYAKLISAYNASKDADALGFPAWPTPLSTSTSR